jgi:hypothetical protein
MTIITRGSLFSILRSRSAFILIALALGQRVEASAAIKLGQLFQRFIKRSLVSSAPVVQQLVTACRVDGGVVIQAARRRKF